MLNFVVWFHYHGPGSSLYSDTTFMCTRTTPALMKTWLDHQHGYAHHRGLALMNEPAISALRLGVAQTAATINSDGKPFSDVDGIDYDYC